MNAQSKRSCSNQFLLRAKIRAKRSYLFLVFLICGLGIAFGAHFNLLPAVAALAAILAGVAALETYRRSIRTRRLEWLLDLFHRFLDEPKHRRIRYLIVFQVSPDYEKLRELMENRHKLMTDVPAGEFEKSLILDMDDYLNFFELIASLWKEGEVSFKEVELLFNDYLKYLWQTDFTRDYIVNWGFEGLEELLIAFFERK